ncbi:MULTISPECIES: ABC transporter permease [unclassified Exiguobacterium]|uniref:ABC transporter permease n=1 Tax=unclassified Exiguobacterium TaxID=2644629 RepID=UPI000EBBEE0A|nr:MULTISPECIES: ABC transporter permease [unclassified Exiguobacterium]MDT0172330.1 ABC transporter permease [Exiguobacterium sp. BRG2]HCV52592.1 ABC transporter permease [Exiguobacterium sp.]
MWQLARRVIRQTLNDKRSVGLILLAPLLIFTLIYFLLGNDDYTPVVAISQDVPAPVSQSIEKQDLSLKTYNGSDADAYLKDHETVDVVLDMKDNQLALNLREPSTKSSKALREIQTGLASLQPTMQLETNYLYGDVDQSTFDALGFVFLSLFSFFFVFILSAMALVKERSGGTLERLMMTPIRQTDVIFGYTLGYSVFASIQAILVVLYATTVLDLPSEGSIIWVFLTMLGLAVVAVLFGATISIFAQSELQVVQLIPFTIVPQIFFSGLIPLDLIPYGLGNIGYITPIFYGASAIKEVLVYGNGWSSIWPYWLGLFLYGAALFLLNMLALNKYRGHQKRHG